MKKTVKCLGCGKTLKKGEYEMKSELTPWCDSCTSLPCHDVFKSSGAETEEIKAHTNGTCIWLEARSMNKTHLENPDSFLQYIHDELAQVLDQIASEKERDARLESQLKEAEDKMPELYKSYQYLLGKNVKAK